MTNQSPKAYRPKEDYRYFSPEGRHIWCNILNGMKAFVLRSRSVNLNEGVNKHSKDGYKTLKPLSLPAMKFTKANLHQLLAELISETSFSDKNEVNVPKDKTDSESAFLVKYTSANTINPGDIRKLISASGKSKDISKKNQ